MSQPIDRDFDTVLFIEDRRPGDHQIGAGSNGRWRCVVIDSSVDLETTGRLPAFDQSTNAADLVQHRGQKRLMRKARAYSHHQNLIDLVQYLFKNGSWRRGIEGHTGLATKRLN